jgi:phosphoribosyl-ATP pyrophosphohydrolase
MALGSRYGPRMSDSIDRLYRAALAARNADPARSRTAKLLHAGMDKMAKKLAEEAVEVVIDAMRGHRGAVVKESADLVYNLVTLWIEAGIEPQQVWAEMARRERLFGIAEKIPKRLGGRRNETSARRQVVGLEGQRLRKRH